MEDDIVEFDISTVSSTVEIDDSIYNNSDTFTISVDDTVFSDYSIDFGPYTKPGIAVTEGNLTIHDEGDLKIGDRSLKEFMSQVEEKLGIYTLNPELEEEVYELKQLGKQYRELEEKIKSKKKLLETIKNSDTPCLS